MAAGVKVKTWTDELDALLVTVQGTVSQDTAGRLDRIRSIVRAAIEVHQYSAPTADPKVDAVLSEKLRALGRAIYGAGV